MKLTGFIFFILSCMVSFAGLTQDTPIRDYPDDLSGIGSVRVVQSAPEPWSVTGPWHYASPEWRGMIDIRPDGTFARTGDAESGKWKLGSDEDHFVLILKWNHLPQCNAEMITPAEFRADASKGEIIVRRLPQ